MQNEKKLSFFAVACIAESFIILTGGLMDGKASNSCYSHDTLNGKWHEKKLPDLQQGRSNHSNCITSNTIYVIAGRDS